MTNVTLIESQINILKGEVNSMPPTTPNKGLWQALVYVQSAIGSTVDKVEAAVHGNGRDGLLKRMDRVEAKLDTVIDAVKPTKGLREWFIAKVLPQLVSQFISIVIIIFLILAILHFSELQVLVLKGGDSLLLL